MGFGNPAARANHLSWHCLDWKIRGIVGRSGTGSAWRLKPPLRVVGGIGGFVADESNQLEKLELQYRAARRDLRPQDEQDVGCAIIFGMIALGLLGIIAYFAYDWRTRKISVGSVIALSVIGLLAGGAIVAVCGRLTRHRWWGNMNWRGGWGKEDEFKDSDVNS